MLKSELVKEDSDSKYNNVFALMDTIETLKNSIELRNINLTDYLIVNETVSEEDRELYEFGIRETIAILQNLLCTVFIALLFGKIVETIYFLCAFIILRSFAGGDAIRSCTLSCMRMSRHGNSRCCIQ